MRELLCRVLGHRRCRRQAFRVAGIWRSECRRCGERMVRTGSGQWQLQSVRLAETSATGAGADG